MTPILDPADCSTMEQVRAAVDDLDRQIVTLLGKRFELMRAAARIKQDLADVRDEQRKAEVLRHVDERGRELGIDRALLARWYDDLVETSIEFETTEWKRIHPSGASGR